MSRPRFLLSFRSWTSGLSGGDRHLLEMAREWRQHVDIAVVGPRGFREHATSFLGDVPFTPIGSSFRPLLGGDAVAVEYIRRAFAHETPQPADVAVAASHFLPEWRALAKARQYVDLTVVYVYHLAGPAGRTVLRYAWTAADEFFGLRALRRNADLIFTSNRTTAENLRRRGIDPAMTNVGINVSLYGGWSPRTQRQVLFLGRLVPTKGIEDALRAWSVVMRAIPDARLVVVGDGPLRERGRRLAIDLGLDEVVSWAGFVPEQEKMALLRSSAALLAPSYEEGWGIAVCEALASGAAVVAYDLPVLQELFGGAFFAVPPGDVGALAECTIAALSDSDRVRELTDRGVAVAARYDTTVVAEEELQSILDRLHRERTGR